MFIYIFLLVILFFLGYAEIAGSLRGEKRRICFVGMILIFWFLSFVRWKTGTDWDSYYTFFSSNVSLQDFQNRLFEPFYTYIAFFVKQVTKEYWILLLVYGSIIYLTVSPTIYKLSPLPLMSIIFYFLLRKADIFFTRESIALAFCLLSLRFIVERKVFLFLVAVTIGTMFHQSVIVFLLAYYIYHLNISLKKIVTSLIVVFALSFVLSDVFRDYLTSVSLVLGNVFADKTESYLESGDETFGYGVSLQRSLVQGTINNGILFAMFAYNLIKTKSDVVRGMLNLFAFSIVLFYITIPLNLTLARLINSYNIVSIILVGFAFNSFKRKDVVVYYILFFAYMVTRFSMQTFFGGYSYCFIPFRSILW